MEVLLVLIGLMLLTVFVVAIGDKIGLPWPALLTIITACAVFVPGLPQFEPPTELILPIFLPPLLWALARRTSWGVIREQWVTILSLSVLLVVATTLAVGFTAYAFLPGISLAAAILIGAAIAPPDPVAVDAVAEPAGIPRRIITTLQTEGLFNDAASIVAFNLALTAVTQGDELSFGGGVLNFFYSAFVAGGLGWVVGRLVALFITHVHDVTARNALTWVRRLRSTSSRRNSAPPALSPWSSRPWSLIPVPISRPRTACPASLFGRPLSCFLPAWPSGSLA